MQSGNHKSGFLLGGRLLRRLLVRLLVLLVNLLLLLSVAVGLQKALRLQSCARKRVGGVLLSVAGSRLVSPQVGMQPAAYGEARSKNVGEGNECLTCHAAGARCSDRLPPDVILRRVEVREQGLTSGWR